MSDATKELLKLLNFQRLPGRLNAEQTAVLLGFQAHDIPVLVRRGLLKPLGNPAQQVTKYFAAVDIQEHAADTNWLSRATKAINETWATKNQSRRQPHQPDNKTINQTNRTHIDASGNVSRGPATYTTTSL